MASFASINNVDDVWVPTEENPKEIDRNDNVWADVAHITGIGGSVGQLSYTTAAFAKLAASGNWPRAGPRQWTPSG